MRNFFNQKVNETGVIKHCKREFKVIKQYSQETNLETIEYKGQEFVIVRLPRPAKNEADLICVFVNGIKYTTFAKFLKSI